eukprot:1002524-Pelagomonas_calceolata.AAC.1
MKTACHHREGGSSPESPGGGTSRVAPRFFSTRPLRKVSRASSRALGSRPVADRPASHATMHTWRDSTCQKRDMSYVLY